jgi:hypothetical protein
VLEEDKRDCWVQHDGATAHTVNATIASLQDFSGERIVGRGLGHRDLQTLPRRTFFCWDFSKKEFIGIAHEAWSLLE